MDPLKRAAAAIVAVALAVTAGVVFTRSSGPKTESELETFAAPEGTWLTASCALPPAQLRRIVAGTYAGRSPDLQYVPQDPHLFGSFALTTHSGPWAYLQDVPVVFYGPGYIMSHGDLTLDRRVTVADIAPTFAELLGTTLPENRPGRSVSEALEPIANRTEPPRMIVLVVWDGGGWNVLDEWPNAWPNLKRLMGDGTSVQDAEVGSSPSVTPAIHMTMGTGDFPAAHGIVDIPMRKGNKVVNAFPDKSPKFMALETLADLYDPTTNNRSKIGVMAERAWHLGMMGRGAYLDGGDRDIAVLTHGAAAEGKTFTTDANSYRLPAYLENVPGFAADRENVDLSDGKDDGLWMGHALQAEKDAGVTNPVWTRYQLRLLKSLWATEGFGQDAVPDLFFTNFKEVDLVGHGHNMVNPEMRSTLEHTDFVLGRLVADLDARVGAGRWVMAVTADHGQGPSPRSTGGWPIDMEELQRDIARVTGTKVDELFQGQRPTGMWFNPRTIAAAGIALEDLADFILGYTIGDNVPNSEAAPAPYRDRLDEKLFAAAMPTDRLDEVTACSEALP